MHITTDREKAIRKAVRVRLRAQPLLLDQWKKQQRTAGERVTALLGVLFAGAFFTLVPAAVAGAAGDRGGIDWSVVLAVAMGSLACGIALGNWLLNELIESRFLAVSSLLPVTDRRLVDNLTWLYLGAAGVTIVPAAGFFARFAWTTTHSWSAVGIALGLAASQTVVHAAVGLVAVAWFRRWCRPLVVAVLALGALLGALGVNLARLGLPNIEILFRPLTIVLPTGWNLMCFIEAGIDDSSAGWWYLFPVALLVAAAIVARRIIRDEYTIVEFELLEDGTACVADFGRIPSGVVFPIPIAEWDPEPRPRTELQAEVRSRKFLNTDHEEDRIIERIFYDLLSDDERRSLDVLTGGQSLQLTKRVTIVAKAVVIVTIVGIAADACFQWGGWLSCFGWAGWIAGLCLLSSPEASLLHERSGLQCGTTSLLPFDWSGFHRVVNLAAILQGLFLLPLSIAVAGIGLWAVRGQLPWLETVSLGFKPLLVFVALYQFWMQALIPIDATHDRIIGGGKQAIDFLLISTLIGGGIWMFFSSFTEIGGLIATGLLFSSGWLHRRYYRWLIVKRHTELVALPENDS